MFLLKKILTLLLFFPYLLAAQVQDDFSDGNLTADPAWQGDAANFIVNPSAELQLNAPAAGASTLYLPTLLADSAVWELYFRLDFDPSTSNSLRIALQSDSEDFATASGYFLYLGETGGGDAISFIRQDAGTETTLATATAGAVAVSPNVRLRMERTADAAWTLLVDYTGNFNYAEEFQVTDATYTAGSYFFGMQCVYTATRTDKFFFDDILVGELLPDTEPPVLAAAEPLSPTEVDVTFNEPLDEATATATANFSISGGIGAPAVAQLDAVDKTLVHLSLASPLLSQTDYVLTASGVADLLGNVSAAQTAGFSYLEIETASEFDLLINEFMADPSPTIGLPDAEFVELLNRSNKVIDLAGHGLSNGGAPQILPSYLLYPGEAVIVCDDGTAAQFAPFGNVVVLASFPALTNGGDDVILTNPAGNIVHQITYTLATYRDAAKTDGGWSIELVNPLSPCTGEANYRASVNLTGGTPGQPNSVLNEQPDDSGPALSGIAVQPLIVELFFNKILEKTSAEDVGKYTIPGGPTVVSAQVLPSANTVVRLTLAAPLATSLIYEMQISAGLVDCRGFAAAAQTATFALPEIAAEFDLLINEFMADPSPTIGLPDAEFVELLNQSNKIIDLAGYRLSNGSSVQVLPKHLLFPGELVIVCANGAAAQFATFGNVVPLSTFPALTNGGDDVILSDPTGNVVHQLAFTLSSYRDASKDDGGWSLELVNPSAPCSGEANLRASASLLGGTPGQPNSVRNEQPDDIGPTLVRPFARPTFVELFFDEILEKSSAEDASNYTISGGGEVVSAQLLPPANTVVRLTLAAPLAASVVYEVQVDIGLMDCIGNISNAQTATFALPEPIGEGELLINEILFDPPSGGGDFVEIFNPTDKVFNLGDLLIGNIREGVDTVISAVVEDRLIFPGEYAVIAEATGHVLNFFMAKKTDLILENDLPAFNSDKGNVTLLYQSGPDMLTIDAFDYSDNMHAPLLDLTKGVSLERIDPNRPSQSAANWHSAASTVGYATPTYLNSQHLLSSSAVDGFFDIPEKKLSPNGDGYQDFLVVNYQLDRPGYSVRAQLFDMEGRSVKTVFDNELLPTEGFFRWDGDTDRGEKARTGIYVLWIQLFHPDGSAREFKETCVVAF